MGTTINSYLLPCCVLILFSSISQVLSVDSTYNNFLQCLKNQSNSSTNISTILYSKENKSYNSVLQAYIRNLRFTYPTTSKPLLIITPFTPSQVSASVVCARKLGHQVKIRSGGHDYDGLSYISDHPFVILDMQNLRHIEVDPKAATAYIEAGSTLGELYYRIQEKTNTLGFPAGVCPTVGVGGHVSGGGYGNMIRKYGLSVDHIIDATVVDAQGRILNRSTMGDDLFWAIRGGGGASFAVVVSYTVNLVPVPETVTVFNIKRFLTDNATDLVYKWQFLMKDIDHNLFIRLLLQPVSDPQNKGKKTGRVTFIALYLGDSKALFSLLNTKFPELGLKKQDCLEMTWGKSALFWANYDNKTSPEVLLNRTYLANYSKRKSDYVQTPITKKGLNLLWKKLITLSKPGMVFNSYGGRMNEIPATDTPFPHRRGNLFKIQYSTSWKDAGKLDEDKYIGLMRELHTFMTPYVSKNPRGAYFNYRDVDIGVSHNWTYQQGQVYGKQYFKGNFDRLVKVKTLVDPTNFFRNEQSIPTLKSLGVI
ncbi:berberine bridge enzyme-like 21 [Spinacia oleracea]|uniref:Berberine bridge enzyme-like 21 n=1 Tax=Spinacia oleracea TaxID=3562 RepID=A0A9R0I8Y3_SPIOL|nr:berberine bridge enzyme-like 21 [Spinacia oleracea]